MLRAGALVVTVLALLAGCSAMIRVHIGGSLEQPYALFGNDPNEPEKACVDTIAVQELPHDTATTLWSVQYEGRSCRRLGKVAYGQAPKGFETTVQAASLRAGVRYYVTASGRTGAPLMTVPWRGGGAYIFEDGQWRRAQFY